MVLVTRGIGWSVFFLLPLYTRYLTPEDYGVLALVGMFGEVLFILTNMGQNSAVFRTYFLHENPQERETVITTALWIVLVLSFPIGLVALALSKPLSTFLIGTPDYMVWVMIGVGGVIFKTLLRMPLAILRAREESRLYALSSFAQTVIGLVLALTFVVGLHLGGRGVLLSQLLAEVVLCAYLIPMTLRGLKFKYSSQDARHMLGYGVYLMPTALGSFLIQLSNRYFLRTYASLDAVGLYALGSRLSEALSFPMQAFGLAWPQFLFSNQKSPDAPVMYARVFTYLLAVLGGLWLLVSLLGKEVIMLLVAPSFHSAYLVVPWVAGAFVMRGLNVAGNVGINLQRKVKYRPVIIAATAVVNVTLNFMLIPRYGMMGAAWSSLASYTFQAVFRILVSQRLYPVPYEYARLGQLTLVIGVLYGLGVWMTWETLFGALVGKICLFLSFPLCLYAIGFFESQELVRLKSEIGNMCRRALGFIQVRGT